VNGVPRTESLRQVSPRHARLGDVENRVHEGAVGQIRWSATPTRLGRQQGFDSGPFRITQFVPVHSQTKATGRPLAQIFGQSVSEKAARMATPAASSLPTATTITT
jgi:hypothetical protein